MKIVKKSPFKLKKFKSISNFLIEIKSEISGFYKINRRKKSMETLGQHRDMKILKKDVKNVTRTDAHRRIRRRQLEEYLEEMSLLVFTEDVPIYLKSRVLFREKD